MNAFEPEMTDAHLTREPHELESAPGVLLLGFRKVLFRAGRAGCGGCSFVFSLSMAGGGARPPLERSGLGVCPNAGNAQKAKSETIETVAARRTPMSQAFSTVLEALRSSNPLRLRRILWITLVLASCARRSPPVETTTPPAASLSASARPHRHAVAPATWFENDYAGALALARSRKLPLFVDASAVWCHTCLAMRAFVLDEPALEKSAFVWFSFDVEGPGNDADRGSVSGQGLAHVFRRRSRKRNRPRALGGSGDRRSNARFLARRAAFDRAFARRLAAPGRPARAASRRSSRGHGERPRNRKPRASPRPSARRRPPGLEGRTRCSRSSPRSSAEKKTTRASSSRSKRCPVTRSGARPPWPISAPPRFRCAVRAPPSSARARTLRELVAKKLREVARDPAAPLSPDDRGDAFRIVWDAEEALGHHDGALAAARERLEVLDAAAKRAPNAAVASTFDGARLGNARVSRPRSRSRSVPHGTRARASRRLQPAAPPCLRLPGARRARKSAACHRPRHREGVGRAQGEDARQARGHSRRARPHRRCSQSAREPSFRTLPRCPPRRKNPSSKPRLESVSKSSRRPEDLGFWATAVDAPFHESVVSKERDAIERSVLADFLGERPELVASRALPLEHSRCLLERHVHAKRRELFVEQRFLVKLHE